MLDGRLADRSNFGKAVDIGLPAENLLTIGVNAHQRMMSGSSFAVPKLTAYVICIANAAPPNPPDRESASLRGQKRPEP